MSNDQSFRIILARRWLNLGYKYFPIQSCLEFWSPTNKAVASTSNLNKRGTKLDNEIISVKIISHQVLGRGSQSNVDPSFSFRYKSRTLSSTFVISSKTKSKTKSAVKKEIEFIWETSPCRRCRFYSSFQLNSGLVPIGWRNVNGLAGGVEGATLSSLIQSRKWDQVLSP